jgi:hypothetical protein
VPSGAVFDCMYLSGGWTPTHLGSSLRRSRHRRRRGWHPCGVLRPALAQLTRAQDGLGFDILDSFFLLESVLEMGATPVQPLSEHKKNIFVAIQLPVHALARPGATIAAELPLKCVHFRW